MFYLSECLIIKDENQYLVEHLAKGVQSGIDHFYIYDNYSQEPVREFLEKSFPEIMDKCTIELFQAEERVQAECYDRFLSDHRNDTKWCIFIDTDEILEGDLKKYCQENEQHLSLRIRQIVHGCNGQAYADFSKTMTERFQEHIIDMYMAKTCTQVKYIAKQDPHHSYINRNTDVPMRQWMKMVDWNTDVQLHHYYTRSFEEWLMKVKRGDVLCKEGTYVNRFFKFDNKIDEKDKEILLEKYGLKMDDRMLYGGKAQK